MSSTHSQQNGSQQNGSATPELNGSRQYSNEDQPPIIVHCGDGATESGVYLLVDAIMQSIENNVEIDIPNMLRNLRQQRMYLIRNVESYRFVYNLVENLLVHSRLI
jgi:protein tyrosine phosphatase